MEPRYEVGVGIGAMRTDLIVDTDRDFGLSVQTMSLALTRYSESPWNLRAGVGIITGGSLVDDAGQSREFNPGAVLSVSADRIVRDEPRGPVIDISVLTSASMASFGAGTSQAYTSLDLRVGTRATWTVNDNHYPFLALRLFGGPVFIEELNETLLGTDRYHYQLALGLARSIGDYTAFVEWVPLGERSISVGLSRSMHLREGH